MSSIAETAKIYANVRLGENVIIEDYCLIGLPPQGIADGELETIIGDGAIIRSHTVIYAGNKIGKNFQSGHKVNIRELNQIGDNVSVGTHSVVEHHVQLEDGVRLHSNVFVPEYTLCEAGAWLGPNVVLTNAKYPQSPGVKSELKGPRIGKEARIGANSTLLPGVEVGAEALIGAGSVVTKSVACQDVVVGNPAKVVKKLHDLPYGE